MTLLLVHPDTPHNSIIVRAYIFTRSMNGSTSTYSSGPDPRRFVALLADENLGSFPKQFPGDGFADGLSLPA
jgi:hypothetical protein